MLYSIIILIHIAKDNIIYMQENDFLDCNFWKNTLHLLFLVKYNNLQTVNVAFMLPLFQYHAPHQTSFFSNVQRATLPSPQISFSFGILTIFVLYGLFL